MSGVKLSDLDSDVIRVEFSWLAPGKSKDLALPAYHSTLAAGMDVQAAIDATIELLPGGIKLLATGFALAIPPGFEIQVRPRSGLAIKHGITVINAPGTIDADYRGEVKIGLINLGSESFTIKRGDRIAQLILAPVCRADLRLVTNLDKTARQAGGFGHTGL